MQKEDKKQNIFAWVILLILAIVILFFWLTKTRPEIYKKPMAQIQTIKISIPKPHKNITINGIDYLMMPGKIGKYGGQFRSSTIGEGPKTFNPWASNDATSSSMSELMFDGLVTIDAYTGQVIPRLAKSFQVKSEGREYIIKMRKGVKWSDGKPITADDVVFTFNEIVKKGLGNPSVRDNLLVEGEFPKVEKIDDYTVRFSTKKPFAPFLRQIGVVIAPKHILKPIADKGAREFEAFWGVTTPPEKFVTSGPFMLERYVPAQRVVFKRNPNYYFVNKEGNKLPYLDKYIIYIVGDLNNEMLKFIGCETDLLTVRGKDIDTIKNLSRRLDIKIYNLGADTGSMFLAFNLNTRKNKEGNYYVNPIKQKWFNDDNFRKAVDWAIDRDDLILNILNGVGQPLFTAESLESIYLNKKLEYGHKKDIKKAKEFLRESGFYWNKKGELFDKYGNRVEFTLLTSAGQTEREYTGVMIKEDLERIGIKVNFRPIEFNALVGKLSNTLDWEAVIIGLTGNPTEPNSGKNVWKSTGALHLFNQRTPNDKNTDLLSWEKELDKLFEEGAMEMDFNKRKKIYDKYQEIVYDKLPFIYLYSNIRIYAIKDRFGNIAPTPLGGMVHNIEEIYVK